MNSKGSGTKRRPKGYTISAVADYYELHQQTLRMYEREGLLTPSRSVGNVRLYTDEDITRLEIILQLTRELGVNLAGVEIILNMRERMDRMQLEFNRFVEMLREYAAHQSGSSSNQDQNEALTLSRPSLFKIPVTDRERPGLKEYEEESEMAEGEFA
ncbi:MAG: MerR family transcriptional regulator [Acidobacteria bacterium]|nr:MerR family transcriptional regulator [Acidobacteriota bacterium]